MPRIIRLALLALSIALFGSLVQAQESARTITVNGHGEVTVPPDMATVRLAVRAEAKTTGAALDEVVASGKVRAVGVSNFKLHDWTLLQSAMKTKLVTNQIELSLGAHQGFTNGDVAYLQERGIPPMAWSPLGGGALMTADNDLGRALDRVAKADGVDRAAVATAWLLAHPARIMPVMGSNTISRIKGFSDALDVDMTRARWFELYTAALGDEVP